MYKNTRAKVFSPDGESEFFEFLAGVLQGDTPAPFLFIIVVDYLMRKLQVVAKILHSPFMKVKHPDDQEQPKRSMILLKLSPTQNMLITCA